MRLFDVADGDRMALTYDMSYGDGETTIEGEVSDAHLSPWTKVTTDDGAVYTVYGSGVVDRERGDVVRSEVGKAKRKVGVLVSLARVETDDSGGGA